MGFDSKEETVPIETASDEELEKVGKGLLAFERRCRHCAGLAKKARKAINNGDNATVKNLMDKIVKQLQLFAGDFESM